MRCGASEQRALAPVLQVCRPYEGATANHSVASPTHTHDPKHSAVAAARRVLFSREGGQTGGYLLQNLGELVRRDDPLVQDAEDLLLTKFSQAIPRVALGAWWSPDQATMRGLQRERKIIQGVRLSPVQAPLGASLGHAARSCGAYGVRHPPPQPVPRHIQVPRLDTNRHSRSTHVCSVRLDTHRHSR